MKIILKEPARSLQPIYWYGEAVHSKYDQILTFLESRGRPDLAARLAKPVLPEEADEGPTGGEIRWLSDQVSAPVPISEIDPGRRRAVEDRVAAWLNEVTELSKTLQREPDSEVAAYGELLGLTVEIPDLEHVLVEGERFAITGWGFKSSEPARRDFRLTKALGIGSGAGGTKQGKGSGKPKGIKGGITGGGGEGPKGWRRWLEGGRRWLVPVMAAIPVLVMLGLLVWWLSSDPLPPPGLKLEKGPVETKRNEFGQEVVAGRLLVMLTESTPAEEFMRAVQSDSPGHGIEFEGFDSDLGLLQVGFTDEDEQEVREYFRSRPEVISVSSDPIHVPEVSVNDPALLQPREGRSGYRSGWELRAVGALDAWDAGTGSGSVRVAIIDARLDAEHPELSGRVSETLWLPGNTPDLPAPSEENFHGLHVSGTALGALGNGRGSAGLCPDCTGILIDVMTTDGKMPASHIVKAVSLASRLGADVINMSLSLKLDPLKDVPPARVDEVMARLEPFLSQQAEIWDRLFKRVTDAGALVVASAGNDNGPVAGNPKARAQDAVIVGAVAANGRRASFSNYGSLVTVSAPGVQVYSAGPGGDYSFLDGTSMAAPIVAGAAGLLRSLDPELGPRDVRRILVATAREVPPDAKGRRIGPVIDLAAAVKAVQPSAEACSCEDLLRRLEQIERRLGGGESAESPRLSVPSTPPDDFAFAEGEWVATELLYRTTDRVPGVLWFRFLEDGSGRWGWEFEDGTCEGPASLTMEGPELVVRTEDAPCEGPAELAAITAYVFRCGPSSVGAPARCSGQSAEDGSNPVQFELVKRE